MRNRLRRLSLGLIAVFAVIVSVAALALHAQSSSPSQRSGYTPPRTAWGDPDLQGFWPSTRMVGVPFERPKEYGNRLFLTDQEFKARQTQAERQRSIQLSRMQRDFQRQETIET